jgi:hypothetical protein
MFVAVSMARTFFAASLASLGAGREHELQDLFV